MQSLCPSMCSETPSQVCGGKVLRCLSDKSEEIKADACRKEVKRDREGAVCHRG